MSSHYGLVVAALAVGGLGLVFALREPSRGPAPSTPEARPLPPTPEVSQELAALRAEVAALKAQRSPEPAPPPLEAPPPAAVAAAAEPSPVTLEAAAAHFEQVLESEPKDAAWAREEERRIDAFVRAEAGDGAALESVSCRSTLCRMKVRFADDTSRKGFKLKIGLPPLNNGGFYQDEGDERLVFFAAREGHPLPEVPSD